MHWRNPRRVRRRASGRSVYNYMRDYDPATARYVESDPIGLRGGSYSTYGYVCGNSVSGIDPFGLAGICRQGSSYYDCDAPPPSGNDGCERASTMGFYVVGWNPCAKPQSADCEPTGGVQYSNQELLAELTAQPAAAQRPAWSLPWSASTALGGSFGGFDLFGCTVNASAGTGGLSGYGGCGVGLGGLATRWRWQNSIGLGNPSGWGLNGQLAGGAFGGAGSLSLFVSPSGVSATVNLGNGSGGTANMTLGYRGNH
jgi:RHS repeat-associated protein